MRDIRNVGAPERWISLAAGGLLAFFAVRKRGALGLAAAGLSAELLYRGATGFCPIYGALGIDTAPARNDESNGDAAVPYGRGVRVEQSVQVACAPDSLYAFWRKLETLPQFMQHLEEVTTLTPQRSRWRVRAPIGSRLTWEAELVNDVPGELIAWRSLPGAAVHHAGSVHFDRRGAGTEVRVVLEYAPPARYLGASIARVLGEEPSKQIAEDLRRFKAIAERGEHANLQ